jgi:alanine racemase
MLTSGSQAVLDIDLAAIVANWRTLCARHPSGQVSAVIKADAYGLGANQIAPALAAAGCTTFFVAYVEEAVSIRAVLPNARIAVLSGLIPGTEDLYTRYDLVPVLGSLHEIDLWAAAAASRQRSMDAMLHVDTGMSRLGLSESELSILAGDHARLGGITLLYVLTHLVSAEEPDDPLNLAQAQRFSAARARLPAAKASLANSSGIFLAPDFASDLARPGAALYGVNPTPGQPNPMQSVALLRGRVLAVRDVPLGASVGYNATWTAPRPSRIATVGIGYADGFHRTLSSVSQASPAQGFFDGNPVPLVGRVSMDLTTFDVTDCPAVQPGAWLEILGPHQSPDQLARAAGTNGYEVLTSLGRRFHRMYRPA